MYGTSSLPDRRCRPAARARGAAAAPIGGAALLALTAAVALATSPALAGSPRAALLSPADTAMETPSGAGPDTSTAAGRLVAALPAGPLRGLVGEVLERNPDLAALAAAQQAAEQRPAQARALPDPMLGLTAFPEPPQTRVGPVRLGIGLSQKIPWFGTLGLRGEAASADAAGAAARLEAGRLRLVTETRRLYFELAYLGTALRVVREDRATLAHYEELSRARYATGIGLQQAVIKIQAEMTRADARRIELETQRAGLLARINALRARPEGTAVEVDSLPRFPEVQLDSLSLRSLALTGRPEMAEATAQIDRSNVQAELAGKKYLPDLNLGVTYSFVGHRTDAPGVSMPPPDNGADNIAVSLGVSLPIWRGSLAAGVEEAAQVRLHAEQARRSVAAGIDGALDDLLRRVPLTWDRLDLYQDVLGVQAEQSLRSAEAAYAATTVGALDLLDAERVLLEVRIATARARADYAIALAQLEGAVGAPVITGGMGGER